jgi:putative redox protein
VAVKTADLTLAGDGLRFVAESGSGHRIVLDNSAGDTGMRPAELVPLAVAGCTAMDVISILRKKRQPVDGYEVHASGIQEDDHPNAFRRLDIVHVVSGSSLDVAAVRRAIELSATKYCSVGSTLASGMVEIHHRFVVRSADGIEETDEVIVTGPYALPGETFPSPGAAAVTSA